MEKVDKGALDLLKDLEKSLEEECKAADEMCKEAYAELVTVRRLIKKMTTKTVTMEMEYRVADNIPRKLKVNASDRLEFDKLFPPLPPELVEAENKAIYDGVGMDEVAFQAKKRIFRPGLQKACLAIVNASLSPLTVKRIANRIQGEFPGTPMATVNTTLMRAMKKQLVSKIVGKRNRRECFVWYAPYVHVTPPRADPVPVKKRKTYRVASTLPNACVKIIERRNRPLSAGEIEYFVDKTYGVTGYVSTATIYRCLSDLAKADRIVKMLDRTKKKRLGKYYPVMYVPVGYMG